MAEKKITADKKAEEAVKEVKAEVKSAAEKTGFDLHNAERFKAFL